jgi:hypothetical protein
MVSSLVRLAFVLSVVAGSQSAGSQVPLESQSVPQEATSTAPSPSTNKAEAAADVPSPDEEPPEGELAPAALKLDVSNTSPLIEELYLATRETKSSLLMSTPRWISISAISSGHGSGLLTVLAKLRDADVADRACGWRARCSAIVPERVIRLKPQLRIRYARRASIWLVTMEDC